MSERSRSRSGSPTLAVSPQAAMARRGFSSILNPSGEHPEAEATEPDCFADLRLDQVVAAVLAHRSEYELDAFFWCPLHDPAVIRYRHEVVRDLQRPQVRAAVTAFADTMRRSRQQLTQISKLYYRLQQERWLVDALDRYRHAVRRLGLQLSEAQPSSAGLSALVEFLNGYLASERFTELDRDTEALLRTLDEVRYDIHIHGARVRVSHTEDRPDLTADVQATFDRFSHQTGSARAGPARSHLDMNHVEAQILELVARLHPAAFAELHAYWLRHRGAVDDTLLRFEREVQFYLAYLEQVERIGSRLSFCLPDVDDGPGQLEIRQGFDLALARRLVAEDETVVCNDLVLSGSERIVVITGPNQGGKTTFARMVGQIHHLASLGLPVPAAAARVGTPDRLFTHFEREESLLTLRGRFEDELVRIRQILEHATANSLLIMNESFGSTSLRDARLVGGAILEQIISLGATCVFVTFVDELSALGEATVSMMSTVDPDDPTRRTFTIARKPADGLAYAAALAERYGLSYTALKRRVGR